MKKNHESAFVKNAADEKQVKQSVHREKIGRDQELEDIQAVMQIEAGRRFIWRLLARCGTFGSVSRPNYGETYYVSGQQDIGHFIMGELAEADEMILGKLMMENYKGDN